VTRFRKSVLAHASDRAGVLGPTMADGGVPGLTMADGGVSSDGPLERLDDAAWRAFMAGCPVLPCDDVRGDDQR
jgi:hypothetical protein